MILNIHSLIKEKLQYFYSTRKIPNIIFHGPSGSGKRTIVHEFIQNIYENNRDKIKSLVMYVNCAHGKGDVFKSIILLNADKLTMDAQSALRRCIELFSHNTRFFIIVEDKYKLLKPILSRFCEIYVSEPLYNNNTINLYKYNLDKTFNMSNFKTIRFDWLKKDLMKLVNVKIKLDELIKKSIKIYEKGYSGIDIINLLETSNLFQQFLPNNKKYELLIAFNKVRKEFRNEKLLILFILNFVFLSSNLSLENINFM